MPTRSCSSSRDASSSAARHAELLQLGGRYASLYALQSSAASRRSGRRRPGARAVSMHAAPASGRGRLARPRGRRAPWSARRSIPRSRSSPPSTAASCGGSGRSSAPIGAAGPGRARRARVRREPDRDPADPAHRDRRRAGRGRATTSGCSTLGVLVFFGVVTFNFLANLVQETLVARIAERLLIDLRRAMYAHLQRVSLSFMDKTEVGRLMSRLQGDVHALQEFLETSVFAIGDFVLLVGITIVLLVLDWRLGLLTLSVVPILVVVRIIWLPRARRAFLRARDHQLDPERRARRGHPRRPHGAGHGPRGGQPAAVRGEGRRQSGCPAARHLAGADHGADRRHADRRRDGHRHRGRRHGRARRPARARRDGRLPVLRPALLRSDPLADHAVQRHAAGHGVGPAHLRGAGRADRGPGQAGRARSREHRRLGRVPRRHLRLRPGHSGPAQRELPGRARRDRGAGRPDRLGQDQHDGAGPPLLRRLERAGSGRRPRRARSHAGLARPPHRHGPAGAVPVYRHGSREHPLRHPGDAGTGDRGGHGRGRARLHHAPAARLRHAAWSSGAATCRSGSGS